MQGVWAGFLKLSKKQGSHIFWCLCRFVVFFQTRRAGEECAEQDYLAVLGQYCHRVDIVSSGRSHEQFLLARPSSGGRSGQWKAKGNLNPGLASLPFSLWLGRSSAESGLWLSIWSRSGHNPGASQLLPGSPDTGSRPVGPQFPNSVGKT